MIADCPGCAPATADVREPNRARARLPWLGVAPAILYVLAPKCPMCLVAYLSAFGVTVGVASLALSVLGPLAVASLVATLGFAIWRAKLRRSSSSADGSISLVGRREAATPRLLGENEMNPEPSIVVGMTFPRARVFPRINGTRH